MDLRYAHYVGMNLLSIWIDKDNGTPGTKSYINGTVINPVNSFLDALTIARRLKIFRFHFRMGNNWYFISLRRRHFLWWHFWA